MTNLNDPKTVSSVTAAFERYEAALIANDVTALQNFFWNSPSAVRFGVTEQLYGFDAIAAFRKNRILNFKRRDPKQLTISTFGDSMASVMYEYISDIGGGQRHGRQSQTWVKLKDQWKIVSAHISLVSQGSTESNEVKQALSALALNPEPEWLERIQSNYETTAILAKALMEYPLPNDTEPAPVFHARC